MPVYIHMYTLEGTTDYSTHSNEQPTHITWNVSGPAAEINSGSSLTLEWMNDPHRVQDASDVI